MSEYRLTKDECDDLYASAAGNYIKMQMVRQLSHKGYDYDAIETELKKYDADSFGIDAKVRYPEQYIDDEPHRAYESESDCYHHDDDEILNVKMKVKTVLAEVDSICNIFINYEHDPNNERGAMVAKRIKIHMRTALMEYADCQLYYDEM